MFGFWWTVWFMFVLGQRTTDRRLQITRQEGNVIYLGRTGCYDWQYRLKG